MQKVTYLSSFIFFIWFLTACQGSSEQITEKQTVTTQIRIKPVKRECDGLNKSPNYNPFESVIIGKQEWNTYNLNVDTFRNGDPIMEAQTDDEWRTAGIDGIPAWCYYDNNTCNAKYGKLYNFHAVDDPRELAPIGWHVPSDEEWICMLRYLESNQALKLKSQTDWFNNGNGDNSSGFNAKPGGIRFDGGAFLYYGDIGYFWTSSSVIVNHAHSRYIREDFNDRVFEPNIVRQTGLSVRLIKDYPKNEPPFDRIN